MKSSQLNFKQNDTHFIKESLSHVFHQWTDLIKLKHSREYSIIILFIIWKIRICVALISPIIDIVTVASSAQLNRQIMTN